MLGYITQHFKKSRNITYCILCYENVNSYNYLTAELNRNSVSYPIPLLLGLWLALNPGPLRGRRKDLVPIAHPCANYPKKTWGTMNDCTLYYIIVLYYCVIIQVADLENKHLESHKNFLINTGYLIVYYNIINISVTTNAHLFVLL